MAGRGVVPPAAVTSLEGLVPPCGMAGWLYRVSCPSGIAVLSHPSPAALPTGARSCGEYVRGVEVSRCGAWLRIERPSHRLKVLSSSSSHASGDEWVALVGEPEPPLVRVEATDVEHSA
eukprot:scaffold17678_cov73-Isochrysis_galbana.AAC.1